MEMDDEVSERGHDSEGDERVCRLEHELNALSTARVDATDPPVLSGAGPFVLNGVGFIAGQTEVLLDTIALVETAATVPLAGQFRVDPGAITFTPPGNLTPGRYTIRVRVNQVESEPAWWLRVS